jgi:hypothetical protein
LPRGNFLDQNFLIGDAGEALANQISPVSAEAMFSPATITGRFPARLAMRQSSRPRTMIPLTGAGAANLAVIQRRFSTSGRIRKILFDDTPTWNAASLIV